MKNKGKRRTDLKYIAVLFVLIMMFSAIGILFGNMQIGNNSNNTNFTPASNPAGTIELNLQSYSKYGYDSFISLYSSGAMALNTYSPASSNNIVQDTPIYYNITGNAGKQVFYNGLMTSIVDFPSYPNIMSIFINNSFYYNYSHSIYTNIPVIPSGDYGTVYENIAPIGTFLDGVFGGFTQTISQTYLNKLGAAGTANFYTNYSFSFVQQEIGQSSVYTASPSGGTSPYYYQWYVDGIATGSNLTTDNTYTYYSSTVGQANIVCHITDSAGAVQWTIPSFIEINPHSVVSINGQQRSSLNTADVGQTINFTGVFVNNLYGYVKNGILYGNTQFASGTSSAAIGSIAFNSGETGSQTIEFYAIDSNGYNATSIITYTIYADPIINALSTLNSGHIYNNVKATDVNIPIYIQSNDSLGSGGYSYSWSVQSTNTNTLTYTPTAVSSGVLITLTITDSNGYTATAQIIIIVNIPLTVVITTITTGT